MNPRRISHACGFTFIELLVVIMVISILAALFLPVLATVKQKARMTQAMSNLRQMGAALAMYENDNNYDIPYRVTTPANSFLKWAPVLAGTDGSGKPNLTPNYVGNVQAYIAPGDPWINPNRPDLFAFLTSNNANNCSWIMNGFNDLGTMSNSAVQIRAVNFAAPAETILLGVQLPGAENFYMDFLYGDNRTVLNLAMYNGGSPYLFADGSMKFITQVQYNQAAPQGSSRYGDWLWLVNKSSTIADP